MSDQTATPETATVDSEAGIDDRADAILGLLGDDEVQDAEAGEEIPEAGETPAEDESDDDTETQPEPEQPRHRVKVNGEEIEVTLDELLKGYSREADSSRKTATVAEERRALEQQREAFKAEQTERANRLNALLQQAETFDPILDDARKTDWAKLAEDDPAGYVAKKAKVEQRVQQLQQVAAERNQLMAEHYQQAVQAGMQHLEKAIPEWADAEKRTATQSEIKTYLTKDLGFQESEISNLVDPRIVQVAYEALQYRKMKAARAAAESKKAAPTPTKTVTPGPARSAQPDAKLRAMKARAAKSGKIDDKAAAILAALG